jgi:peptidoglycan/xylan/chitin deacetylase (PgdA/CDA1 family)
VAFTALMYHSLADGRHPDALYPKYTTRLATFREHLRALLEAEFELGSFRELLESHDAGMPLPDKTCALTFDDGHRSSLDLAEAMMEEGVRGTFFLTARYCREKPDFLKAEDIRALAAEGFDFGTHGVTHRPLKFLPAAEMEGELRESKAWLEEVLGAPVRTMSLPAGQGGAAVANEAFRQGYRLVGTSREAANAKLKVPGTVNRMVVLSNHTAQDVVKIAAASPGYLWKRRLRALAIWLPKRLLRTAHRTRGDERTREEA